MLVVHVRALAAAVSPRNTTRKEQLRMGAWCRGERLLPPSPGLIADVPLYVAAYADCVSIYRDLAGSSLHRWALTARSAMALAGVWGLRWLCSQ